LGQEIFIRLIAFAIADRVTQILPKNKRHRT